MMEKNYKEKMIEEEIEMMKKMRFNILTAR
jgi:hypothetical protein